MARNKHNKPAIDTELHEPARAGVSASGSSPAPLPQESARSDSAPARRKPEGASIYWEIPGDVPGRQRRAGAVPGPDRRADDSPVFATRQQVTGQQPPERQATQSVSAGQEDSARRRFPGLMALLALILLLAITGLASISFDSPFATGPRVDNGAVTQAGPGLQSVALQALNRPDTPASMMVETSGTATTREEAVSAKQTMAPDPSAASEPRYIIHIEKKGDTLWDLAEKYVNDPFRYPELAELSGIDDPHWIYPGDKIRIRI